MLLVARSPNVRGVVILLAGPVRQTTGGNMRFFRTCGLAACLAAAFGASSSIAAEPSMCVAANDQVRHQSGTASCQATGTGSTAIARGVDSSATAFGGDHNRARATGDQSFAFAGEGNNNTAVATGAHSGAEAIGNNNNTTATGLNSFASADGDNNTATASGAHTSAEAVGNNNTATATGDHSSAEAIGNNNSATATDGCNAVAGGNGTTTSC